MIGQVVASFAGQSSSPLVSEIERASTAHARMFALSIAVIFLAAFATAVVTYFVWKSGNRVQEAIRVEANAKIETARATAAEADQKAAEAREGTARAVADAARANERTSALSLAASRLNQQSLEIQSRLERERAARLKMEAAIAPRLLEQGPAAEELKKFQGIQANVETVGDFESRRTAGQIVAMLEMAHWRVGGPIVATDDVALLFADGIDVQGNVGPLPQEDISSAAADALVGVLMANGIKARRLPAGGPGALPLNTLKIRVGLKPIEYFSTKKLEDIPGSRRIFGNMSEKPPLLIPPPPPK